MIGERFGIIAFIFVVLFSCGQKGEATSKLSLNAHEIILGDSSVYMMCGEVMDDGILLLNLHENEQTALSVMIEKAVRDSIPFLFLHQNSQRRIFFRLKDTLHSVDPNRMFTLEGVEKTLRDSMFYTSAGKWGAYSLGLSLLKHVQNRDWVISLHNNTDSNFSILSYMKGGEEERNAEAIITVASEDPDDFILTTDRNLFENLKNAGINIVLQSANPVDDGSLSVYCERNAIPYVNVEVEHGRTLKQEQLLDLVLKSVKKPIPGKAN